MKQVRIPASPETPTRKKNWKSIFLWSSLGGVALGATVTLVRRSSHKLPAFSLDFRKIPEDCPQILVWTERFIIEDNGRPVTAHDKYVLQSTPFAVWSVLELSAAEIRRSNKGSAVYHATHVRILETEGSAGTQEEQRVLARFYGTVRALDGNSKRSAKNALARGATLEINRCRVGGATNGVETGELHLSFRPILNYRFEYTPG